MTKLLPSVYAVSPAKSHFCPYCKHPTTLLSVITLTQFPAFYLCFPCQKVFEVGVGEVAPFVEEPEEETEAPEQS